MKKAFSRLFAVLLVMCLLTGVVSSVSAAKPVDSYTYWNGVTGSGKAVYTKSMYDFDTIIDPIALGTKRLEGITSMYVDDDNNIYVLDKESRILIIKKDLEQNKYVLDTEIGLIDGVTSYNEAAGIYYHDGIIYVCDTKGQKIHLIDKTGKTIDTIVKPVSDLMPDDDSEYQFAPKRVVMDSNDYMYVIIDGPGAYYGALLYSPEREFLGFYGANTVEVTVASVFENISNRLFPNVEKHNNQQKKVPFAMVDITVDDEDFIYTTNGYTDGTTNAKKTMVRRLSPGTGKNILNQKNTFTDVKVIGADDMYKQNFCDIEVDSAGNIYALEARYGKVFIYDRFCRTMNIFAGGMRLGNQKGTFANPSAMILLNDGNEVLISDTDTNYITSFKINAYGKEVKRLNELTANGEYDLVKEGWENILKQDKNNQLAYSGLANAYLEEENYDKALEYAKLGYDKDTYAVAYEYVRGDFTSDNFGIIFAIIVVVVIGAIVLMFVTNKKKLTLIKNPSLSLMFATALHPTNSFTDIKEKKLGSLPLCLFLLVAYYVTTIMETLAGGFMFTNYDPASFNSILVLITSVGLVVLWIVANWMVSTLLGGKGKMKEIVIVTCYSLQPLIWASIIRIVLTNVLLPNEASFLGILSTIATIYFFILLVNGMLKIHDYTMGKFLWTSLLSVIGMAIIVFLMIMLIILIQQFGAFVATLVTEIMTI